MSPERGRERAGSGAEPGMEFRVSVSLSVWDPGEILLESLIPQGNLMIQEGIKLKVPGCLAGVAQWIEHQMQTKGLLVPFPVRAYAWVEGQVPSGVV